MSEFGVRYPTLRNAALPAMIVLPIIRVLAFREPLIPTRGQAVLPERPSPNKNMRETHQ